MLVAVELQVHGGVLVTVTVTVGGGSIVLVVHCVTIDVIGTTEMTSVAITSDAIVDICV